MYHGSSFVSKLQYYIGVDVQLSRQIHDFYPVISVQNPDTGMREVTSPSRMAVSICKLITNKISTQISIL